MVNFIFTLKVLIFLLFFGVDILEISAKTTLMNVFPCNFTNVATDPLAKTLLDPTDASVQRDSQVNTSYAFKYLS